MVRAKPVDKVLLGITIALVVFGIFAFASVSLSILAADESRFYGIVLNQVLLGLVGGVAALVVCIKLPYPFWRKYSFWLFIIALGLTALVFIPGLGVEHGGARRWLSIGPLSFQPAELLKIAFVLYLAAWLAAVKKKVGTFAWGFVPFLVLLGLAGILLLLQPDTGTFIVLGCAGAVMFFVAGAKWKHLGILVLIGLIGAGLLVATRPYLLDRVKTFSNPDRDPLGSSYQIRQSLIAVGSGKIVGRGYGQSVQKFNYLPEPTGDSIFAVIGEELGFVGSVVLIVLFLAFALRGLRVAVRGPDMFARLATTGIVILILSQSFVNIASVVGLFPLTGLPLIFISHGGTALLFSLAGVGIVLNISRYQRAVE